MQTTIKSTSTGGLTMTNKIKNKTMKRRIYLTHDKKILHRYL